jgi:hypothetical protein
MKEHSPHAYGVNAAICEHRGKVHFSHADYVGGIIEFMSQEFLKSYHNNVYIAGKPFGNLSSVDWSSLGNQIEEVDCLPLNGILHKARIRHIHFFILDVEVRITLIIKSLICESSI